jgi:hypothetical protein
MSLDITFTRIRTPTGIGFTTSLIVVAEVKQLREYLNSVEWNVEKTYDLRRQEDMDLYLFMETHVDQEKVKDGWVTKNCKFLCVRLEEREAYED